MSSHAYANEVPLERVTVFPADVGNLENLAEINQRLVAESPQPAGVLRIVETAQTSAGLAEAIKNRIAPVGDGMTRTKASGVELEVDEAEKRALLISRRLGNTGLEYRAR